MSSRHRKSPPPEELPIIRVNDAKTLSEVCEHLSGVRRFALDTEFVGERTYYPKLELIYYVDITLMVVLAALLSAIYPALRAIRYDPAEATRSV